MTKDVIQPDAVPYPPPTLAWTIWGLGAALYLFGFFQRVAPGVMTSELMKDFNITAASLGNLSAFYFYSYVAMQIPTGLLADQWGPRRLLTAGALGAGIGSLSFALADGMVWACIGRFLIGGSVAVAFVSMLKLSSNWMAPKNYSLASGIALFIGVVGAVFAGTPLSLLISSYGWRPVMVVAGSFPIIIGFLIWIVVRDDPKQRNYRSHAWSNPDSAEHVKIATALLNVLSYRNTWLLFLSSGAMSGSVLTFAGLWGVSFLTTHYGLPEGGAAAVCSALLLSWAVGGPTCGVFSDRLGRRKSIYIACCAVICAGWMAIIFAPGMPVVILIVVLMLIGFASGAIIIGFSFIKESVPPHLAGTSAGVFNMGVMLGPMCLQPVVGWLLDKNWQGVMTDGVRIYGLQAYQIGFASILIWSALSLFIMFLSRETGCSQMEG
jgi:MFS family permease